MNKVLLVVRAVADWVISWFFIPLVSLFIFYSSSNGFFKWLGFAFFVFSVLISVLPSKGFDDMMNDVINNMGGK